MIKIPKEPMTAQEVQPTWSLLTELEPKLRHNIKLSRVLQPVGIGVFAFNLLLATFNLIEFIGGALIEQFFCKMPILSGLVAGLPKGSWSGVIAFSIIFVFLIPLAICGGIFGVFFYLERKKGPNISRPLVGNEVQCAQALTNQAEQVYLLRKRTKTWSTYLVAGILTGILAAPILLTCLAFARSSAPAVLELSLGLFLLLLCLFVVFWVYAALLKGFSHLNALYYMAPGEWTLYLLYRRTDDYRRSLCSHEDVPQSEDITEAVSEDITEAACEDVPV